MAEAQQTASEDLAADDQGENAGQRPTVDDLQAQLDKLAATVTAQTKEMEAMRKSQELLQHEVKALKKERDALLAEAEELRSRPSGSTLRRRVVTSPVPKRTPMLRGASNGARTPQLSSDTSSGQSPPSFQPSPGSELSPSSGSPNLRDSLRLSLRERSPVEEEAAQDAAAGGIYGLSQPLLRPSAKEKVKATALANVSKALATGQCPHSWNGPGTPLSCAVKSRSFDLVRILLEHQGNPDERDVKGVSLMHQAAYDGQVEICRLLLQLHGDPNALDRYGQTPLFFVPTKSVCELLYKAYADVNNMNHKGQSALHLAARAGLGDVLMWLASRVTRALLCLRDAHGSFATDYARRAGVRLETIRKIEHLAAGGLTRDWSKAKARQRGRGGRSVSVPGFEALGSSAAPLQDSPYSEVVTSDAQDDHQEL